METKENAPIKVAVVGLGRAGWDIHVKRMRGDGRFKITAVCDLNEARMEEARAEFGCATFKNFDDLLKGTDADLVVIASQSIDHGPQSIAALNSGRHVLVEKPMAMSVDEATRMMEAAGKNGRKLFVHQNYRYNTVFRHVLEVMESGILGRVFEVRQRGLGFGRRNDWQTLKKYGGGNLNNNGPHFIDHALILLGSPVARLFTDLQLTSDFGDAEDHIKLVFKGENGRVVDMELSTSCAFAEPSWTLLGTNGTMRTDGVNSEFKYFDPKAVPDLVVDETPPANRQYGNGEVLPWIEETRPSTTEVKGDLYDNLVDVLQNDAEMYVKPEQVREVMRIVEIAHNENPTLR